MREALEVGGNGYVEESILARLCEVPLNSIWEAGNVIALDVLNLAAFARCRRRLSRSCRGLRSNSRPRNYSSAQDLATSVSEADARRLVEQLAHCGCIAVSSLRTYDR